MIDKDLVVQRFTKALTTYNKTAIIQPKIIDNLLQYLKNINIGKVDKVLEIGAGTGMLTHKLLDVLDVKQIFINDICEEIKSFYSTISKSEIKFLIGDAEKIEFPKELDMIISASAIQWFEELTHFIKKCSDALRDDGILVLTTFGENNFKEIKEITKTGLKYIPKNQLEEMLKQQFEILLITEKEYIVSFDSPKDILLHCKSTGVSGSNNKIWTKKDLLEFFQKYQEKFQIANKVYLTYHPIFIIAKPLGK